MAARQMLLVYFFFPSVASTKLFPHICLFEGKQIKNILPFIINITLETCHLNNFYFPTVQYRARVGAMQWFSIIQHDTHLYPNFTVH